MNAVKLKFKTIILYSSSMNLFYLQRTTYITHYFFVCNLDLWCIWLYHDVGSRMAPLKVQPQSYSKAQHTIGVPSRSNHFFQFHYFCIHTQARSYGCLFPHKSDMHFLIYGQFVQKSQVPLQCNAFWQVTLQVQLLKWMPGVLHC